MLRGEGEYVVDYCPILGGASNTVSGFIQEILEEKLESSTGQLHVSHQAENNTFAFKMQGQKHCPYRVTF